MIHLASAFAQGTVQDQRPGQAALKTIYQFKAILGASELDMGFSCRVLFAVDAWNCCDLQRRNEECYAPVVQILKYLVNNNLQEGTGAMLNQQGGLPAAAAEEAKAGILRVRLPAQSAVQHTPLEYCEKHLLDIIAYALQGDYTTQCTIYIANHNN